MYTAKRLNIFDEKELDEALKRKLQDMQSFINSRPDNYLLNVNEIEFINYLVDTYSVDNLDINFEQISISTNEKSIPSEMFPRFLFDVEKGRSYTKDVVKYHIPFTGNEDLLACRPHPRTMWTAEVSVEGNNICFEVINFYNDPEKIKQEANSFINHVRLQLDYVKKQVNGYNSALPSHAQRYFNERKDHLLKKNDLLAALDVPIRKQEDIPQTFAIPTPQTQKKIQVRPPSVTERGFKPEPSLQQSTYQEIIQVIHEVGKQFERMPSTYANKSEEDLRDHILLFLEPRFVGSATGETFNKTGKTDILLRYEGSNVFIAECKFWKGAKGYLETISQLLGYLTWRDSKAAIILFVRNKEFSSVLKTIEDETPRHPNFLGFVSKNDETWLNYRVHLNGDPNREVKLAVLVYHIPII